MKDLLYLIHDTDDSIDIILDLGFQSNLSFDFVISLPEVGWGRHDATKIILLQSLHDVSCVADLDFPRDSLPGLPGTGIADGDDSGFRT